MDEQQSQTHPKSLEDRSRELDALVSETMDVVMAAKISDSTFYIAREEILRIAKKTYTLGYRDAIQDATNVINATNREAGERARTNKD